MEDAAQEALLGTTEEQWFIDENKKNPGANYLIGLCTAFIEFGIQQPRRPYGTELWNTVREIADHDKPAYWNFKSLVETPEWKHARSMAKQLLREENTRVTPPHKPFQIEQLIYVDEYEHRSRRRQPRW